MRLALSRPFTPKKPKHRPVPSGRGFHFLYTEASVSSQLPITDCVRPPGVSPTASCCLCRSCTYLVLVPPAHTKYMPNAAHAAPTHDRPLNRHGVAHLGLPLRLGSVRSSTLNKHLLDVNARSGRGLRIRGAAGDFVRSASRPCSFRQNLYVSHRLCAPHLSLEVNVLYWAVGNSIQLAKYRRSTVGPRLCGIGDSVATSPRQLSVFFALRSRALNSTSFLFPARFFCIHTIKGPFRQAYVLVQPRKTPAAPSTHGSASTSSIVIISF